MEESDRFLGEGMSIPEGFIKDALRRGDRHDAKRVPSHRSEGLLHIRRCERSEDVESAAAQQSPHAGDRVGLNHVELVKPIEEALAAEGEELEFDREPSRSRVVAGLVQADDLEIRLA